jgi:hypothetical protein
MQLLTMIYLRCATLDALDWHGHRDWHVYDVTIVIVTFVRSSSAAHRLIAALIH